MRGRDELTRCAIAALGRVVRNEGALQWGERSGFGEPLHRDDIQPFACLGEGEAGIRQPAVHEYRAGAALPVATPELGAGQVQAVEQGEEPLPGLGCGIAGLAVQGKAHAKSYGDGGVPALQAD